MDAQLQGTEREDGNGRRAAIIKVRTTEKGFTFDNGVMGLVGDVEQRPGEIWVYVPGKTKKLTIQHPTLGMIREYRFPISVEAGRCYELVLVSGRVHTVVEELPTQQYVVFEVQPADALIEIEEEPLEVKEGSAQKFLKFGTYNYRISAPNYHTYINNVVVNNPSEPHRIQVHLRPNFGWLSVGDSAGIAGAEVILDGERMGKIPFNSGPLRSGPHRLRLTKPLYKTLDMMVQIEDSMTLQLNPVMETNYQKTTLIVDADAEIWVNNEKRGVRSWTGPLESGEYRIECRQQGHRPSVLSRTLDSNDRIDTLRLEAPAPIYGSLNVSATPIGATIKLDGKTVGVTPMVIQKVLIGEHEVTLSKLNYTDATYPVNIEEGKTEFISAQLSNECAVLISSEPAGAILSIDGRVTGATPLNLKLPAGNHTFRLEAENYKTYEKEINVDGSSPSLLFEMESTLTRLVVKSNRYASLYVDGKYQMGIGGSMPDTLLLPHGNYKIEGKVGHRYDSKTVSLSSPTAELQLNLKQNRIHKNSFYIEGNYSVGGYSGYGGTVGMFIHNWNLEGTFLVGAQTSDPVFARYDFDELGSAFSYSTYKSMNIGGRIGYGFRLGRQIRLTPQVGMAVVKLKEDENTYEPLFDGSSSISATLGARMSWAFRSWLALTLTPEFAIPVMDTDGYKVAREVSSDIDKWSKGFNLRAGLTIFL